MKFTKRERNRVVLLLTYAKSRLAKNFKESGVKTNFICFAIDDAPGFGSLNEKLREYIHEQLEDVSSVSEWVYNRNYLDIDGNINFKFQRDQIQAFRHRWLDHLIKEFSK